MPSKIFVGNLSYTTGEDEIRQHFAEVGEIVEVFLPLDRASGRPRGFAFVTFADDNGAADAIESLDGKELDGRSLRINEAQERPPRQSFGGGPQQRNFADSRPSKPKGSRRGLRGRKRSL